MHLQSFDIHILVLINTSSNNNINIYKTTIKELDNVNIKTKGYPIKKSFITLPSILHNSYWVGLFGFKKNINEIALLFSGLIHMDKLEYNNYNYAEMNKVPSVMGKYRTTKYVDDMSFLCEKFYRYERSNEEEKCFLFLRKLDHTNFPTMLPTNIDFNDQEHNKIWFYDRYVNLILSEFVPDDVKNSFDNDTTLSMKYYLNME